MVVVAKRPKPKPSAFGRKLKELRTAAGMTQQALADAVGVNRAQLAALETSPAANPTLDTLLKLAAALDVSPADLLPPSTPGAD